MASPIQTLGAHAFCLDEVMELLLNYRRCLSTIIHVHYQSCHTAGTFLNSCTLSKQLLFCITVVSALLQASLLCFSLLSIPIRHEKPNPERQFMPKKRKSGNENIETGMVVEATKGDLGEDDVSKPKVSAVARKKGGEIEKLTVQKGVVFKKTLDIPAERIQSIEPGTMDENSPGKVVVDVSREEAASLSAVGVEELASEEEGLLAK